MPSLSVTKVADDAEHLLAAASGTISRDSLMWNEHPEDVLGENIFSRVVLLDLADCDRLDSAGVSWLIRFHRKCEEAGGRLLIHSTPPVISKTLKLLNMGMVLSIAENEQAARQLAASESN
jgi:anti-anti-sigma regulatory factor